MMKHAFYFTSKALFVLKIFKFLSWLFGNVPKQLDQKYNVNFKFHDVTAWLISNLIHILSNISRSKDKQTKKFGQLIECNMRNIFHEKLYTKCGRETSPKPFSEKFKLSIFFWLNSLKFYSLLYCMPSWGLSKYIETKLQITCFYLILDFQKIKRGLELVS